MVKDDLAVDHRSRPRRPIVAGPVRATAAPVNIAHTTKPTSTTASSARSSRNGSAPPSSRLGKFTSPSSAARRPQKLSESARKAPKQVSTTRNDKPVLVATAIDAGGQHTPPPTPTESEDLAKLQPGAREDAVSDVIDTERSKTDLDNAREFTKPEAALEPISKPISPLRSSRDSARRGRSRSRSRSPSHSPKSRDLEVRRSHNESAEYGPNRKETQNPLSSGARLDYDRPETEELSRMLVDVEVDAQAVDIQLGALKDALIHMRNERFLTTTEWNVVNAIRENCVSKLGSLERSSRALRLSIRGRQRIDLTAARIAEQRDTLANRLGIAESKLESVRIACAEKDEVIDTLKRQLNTLMEELNTVERLRDHSEDTRAHLQKQYRLKEAECDRLTVQIRDMQSFVSGSGNEIDKHRKMYEELSASVHADKEQLKKATKAYKERATRLDRELEAVNEQLKQRDTLLNDLQAELTETRVKWDQAVRDAAQTINELSTTRSRCEQLELDLDRRNAELEAAVRRELDTNSEASQTRAELNSLQKRLADAHRELEASRSKLTVAQRSVAEFERRIAAYEHELRESMTESARLSRTLKAAERDGVRFGSTFETNPDAEIGADVESQPRRRSESVSESRPSRIDNATPRHARTGSADGAATLTRDDVRDAVTDALRASNESVMRDANARLAAANQRVREREAAFVDAQTRADELSVQNTALRERVRTAHDEVRTLEQRLIELEKRLLEADQRESDLRQSLSRAETDQVARTTSVDELRRENAALAKQLEHALAESRRAGDLARDKFAIRERTLQQRVSDLEKQVSTLRTENVRARRDREELERRLSAESRDLRDRLEQSQQTNRAMQNYVSFLKHSAAQQTGVDEYRAVLAADSGARMSAVPSLFSGTEFGKQFGLSAESRPRPPSASFGRFDTNTSQPPMMSSGKSDLI